MARRYDKSPKKEFGPAGILDRVIRSADVVLYIIDARFPFVSRRIAEFCRRSGKGFIVVTNKADLLGNRPTPYLEWPSVPFSAKSPGKYKKILLSKIYAVSGVEKTAAERQVRVAVVGRPNVGKSSVINALSHRHSMSVSPQAGHTKAVQWLRLGRIMLSDTPGVITERAPKRELVLTGSLNIEKEDDPVGVCQDLVDRVYSEGRESVLFGHFKIAPCRKEDLIREVALRRGRLMKGGEPHLVEAARIIVSDWQKGKITL